MNTIGNCHELPESGTLIALRAFAEAYERTTGRDLKVYDLACDLSYLRDVLDFAITFDQPELYAAADQLVLALRAAPLPVAQSADAVCGSSGPVTYSAKRCPAIEPKPVTDMVLWGFCKRA